MADNNMTVDNSSKPRFNRSIVKLPKGFGLLEKNKK
jgi:hypothetical protein